MVSWNDSRLFALFPRLILHVIYAILTYQSLSKKSCPAESPAPSENKSDDSQSASANLIQAPQESLTSESVEAPSMNPDSTGQPPEAPFTEAAESDESPVTNVSGQDITRKVAKLQKLRDSGAINDVEYNQRLQKLKEQ